MLADLPPELIVQILASLGLTSAHYTAKERQGDLAAAAVVCSAFLGPAQHLLYTQAVTVRNAGRISLLARTLSANPSLAEVVQTFVQESVLANHHASIMSIFNTCNNLTGIVLCGDVVDSALRDLLCRRMSMRSFTWEGRPDTLNTDILHLLNAWHGLQELTLDLTSAPEAPLSFLSFHAKPRYSLRLLAISELLLEETAFQWLAGESEGTLQDLRIGRPGAATAPIGVAVTAQIPPPSPILPFLPNITTLRLFPGSIDQSQLALFLGAATNLKHLQIGCRTFTFALPGPPPPFLFPPTLQSLELHRRGLAEWLKIAEGLADREATAAIGEVTLVGQYQTDPVSQSVLRACGSRIKVVVRPF